MANRGIEPRLEGYTDDDGFGETGTYVDAAGATCADIASDGLFESSLNTDCADTEGGCRSYHSNPIRKMGTTRSPIQFLRGQNHKTLCKQLNPGRFGTVP